MATIAENTQVDFDNAEAVVIDMLHTLRPGVSFRRGTVLRELLVRPVAEVYAADTRRVDESMRARSLKLMRESGAANTDDVNAILSNFSTSLYAGSSASGFLFVQVARNSVYPISADTVFSTVDGRKFKISRSYVVTPAEMSGEGYLLLRQSESGAWYFLLPVSAENIGSAYELDAGVRLSIDPEFDGFVSATSYAKFSGGIDAQTVDEAIDAIESAVSLRGLGSRKSIESTLYDKNAGDFANSVFACSVVGYGDAEQVRDKDNVFGVATGGKVDLYIRTFRTPSTINVVKTGVFRNHAYEISISHDEMPGYYAVKGVFEPDVAPYLSSSGDNGLLVAGSYPVSEQFSLVPSGRHTLLETPQGSAFSCYRDVVIRVPWNTPRPQPGQREFLVSAYAYPVVQAVQDYVDRPDVRSLRDDILVRSAPICLVRLSASVAPVPGHLVPDIYEMRRAVAEYINGRSFVSRLSMSEIVSVLNKFDILRVEMLFGTPHGFKMQGRVMGASGKVIELRGPDLDLAEHSDPADLISPNTVCFATNIEDIDIRIIGS